MAKTTSVSLSLGRKQSDGDYGSFDAHVTEVIELEDGDDLEQERKALRLRVKLELRQAMAGLKKGME